MEKNKNEDESGRRRIYKKITQQENADQPSPYRQKVSGKAYSAKRSRSPGERINERPEGSAQGSSMPVTPTSPLRKKKTQSLEKRNRQSLGKLRNTARKSIKSVKCKCGLEHCPASEMTPAYADTIAFYTRHMMPSPRDNDEESSSNSDSESSSSSETTGYSTCGADCQCSWDTEEEIVPIL